MQMERLQKRDGMIRLGFRYTCCRLIRKKKKKIGKKRKRVFEIAQLRMTYLLLYRVRFDSKCYLLELINICIQQYGNRVVRLQCAVRRLMGGAIGKVNPEGWLMRWDGLDGSDQIRSDHTYKHTCIERKWKKGGRMEGTIERFQRFFFSRVATSP